MKNLNVCYVLHGIYQCGNELQCGFVAYFDECRWDVNKCRSVLRGSVNVLMGSEGFWEEFQAFYEGFVEIRRDFE